MLGKNSHQYGLFEADRLYLDHVGRDTFPGFLPSLSADRQVLRGQRFREEDCAAFYFPDNGRTTPFLWDRLV